MLSKVTVDVRRDFKTKYYFIIELNDVNKELIN